VCVIKHEGLPVSEDTYEDINGARFASFSLNGMEDDFPCCSARLRTKSRKPT
jgi:hypothetical protein